jgi:peroxiredoxin family protein
MTDLLEHPLPASSLPPTIEKVSIIISQGSLEGIYPGLIMANGARMEGIDANLFFTFFGLDAINKAKHEHVKVATVGNPGLHLATWAGGLPGVSAVVTHKFAAEMEKLDIPPIPEFIELISDSGAGIYACKASVDMFHLTKEDFIPQGAGHHHRRRVLRPSRRRPDHLHLTALSPALDLLRR